MTRTARASRWGNRLERALPGSDSKLLALVAYLLPASAGRRALLLLGIVERQVALDPHPVERREAGRHNAQRLALGQDRVPDRPGVLALAEDLIAALARVAGTRDRDRPAEQGRRHVMEVLQVADPRNVPG